MRWPVRDALIASASGWPDIYLSSLPHRQRPERAVCDETQSLIMASKVCPEAYADRAHTEASTMYRCHGRGGQKTKNLFFFTVSRVNFTLGLASCLLIPVKIVPRKVADFTSVRPDEVFTALGKPPNPTHSRAAFEMARVHRSACADLLHGSHCRRRENIYCLSRVNDTGPYACCSV
jgi:hypothetical protein